MKLWLFLLAFIPGQVPFQGQYCGEERRQVKQLLDAEAEDINWAPIPSTVEALGALPAPKWKADRKRSGQEKRVFQVRAWLISYKTEEDGDLHLVLKGWRGGTMVVELPAESCIEGSYVETPKMARQTFEREFGEWRTVDGAPAVLEPEHAFIPPRPVLVEGVGFYDRIHGQLGVAPNGFELHPVLSIRDR